MQTTLIVGGIGLLSGIVVGYFLGSYFTHMMWMEKLKLEVGKNES